MNLKAEAFMQLIASLSSYLRHFVFDGSVVSEVKIEGPSNDDRLVRRSSVVLEICKSCIYWSHCLVIDCGASVTNHRFNQKMLKIST